MSFLDKAKAAATQAANRAQEAVEDAQLKRSLQHAYEEMGRTAYHLVQSKEISHPRLSGHVDEIRALHEQAQSPGDAS
jgi:hypothetical protein